VVRLDQAENDCADEGKGEIRRQYAQPVDESHGKAPLVYVTARINQQIYQTVPAAKSQRCCLSSRFSGGRRG
jgi:hypothetical protein